MFFVYELIDPRDDLVFYVGKGKGNRPNQHTAEAVKGGRSRKCDRIRSILGDGLKVKTNIVQRFEREDDAYAYEVERIAEIGLDRLTNVLPGGWGGRMGVAVRDAQEMPRSMVLGIAKVLAHAQAGLRITWGGFDVTQFAFDSLKRLIDRLGIAKVAARFEALGVLLTENNNAVREG